MNPNEVLTCALDIGENMLKSGAEVYRVEDCIRRICFAHGASKVDVFSITSSIVLTIEFPGEHRLTQTRRIDGYSNNLERVHKLNQLSRRLCSEKMDFGTFSDQLQNVLNERPYAHWVQMLCYGLIAGAFTIFFGGLWQDALVSFAIGMLLKWTMYLAEKVNFNRVLSNLIASFVMSALSFGAVALGLAQFVDMIVIGNIMLLIPGILLTNSIRDMVSGDTIAGLLRFAEAIILAFAIAAGYILASFAFGGA